jgi:serine/threonine-protein kinase SRPK3
MRQVFTVLSRVALFQPIEWAENNASEVDVLLYQMICFCGEFFTPHFLQRGAHTAKYFEKDCASLFLAFILCSQFV